MSITSKNTYIPPYVSSELKWYERDGLLTYFDRLEYEQFEKNRDEYLQRVKIVNFDIIHHQCRWDELKNPVKYYQTVSGKIFKKMPQKDRKKALGACFRLKRDDLYVQRDLMVEYFKNL